MKVSLGVTIEFDFSEQPFLIEGDIVDDISTRVQIDAEASADGLSNAFDAISGRRKWENGVVPYVYGSVGKAIRLCSFAVQHMVIRPSKAFSSWRH